MRSSTAWRGLRQTSKHGLTNVAAALAYYGFLAIPSALLVRSACSASSPSPSDVEQLLTHLDGIVPASAIALLTTASSARRRPAAAVS